MRAEINRGLLCRRLKVILVLVCLVFVGSVFILSRDMYDLRDKDYYIQNPASFRFKVFMENIIQRVGPYIFTYTNNEAIESQVLKTDFKLLKSPSVCQPGESIDILFLILSHPNSLKKREKIRQTWLDMKPHRTVVRTKHAFVLGNVNPLPKELLMEDKKHKDILQYSCQESRRNLTLKVVSALRWVGKSCRDLKYIVKTDEDVWVNQQFWADLILGSEKDHVVDAMFGLCRWNQAVIRQPWSPYSASYKAIPYYRHRPYCRGAGYGLPLQVAREIAAHSYKEPFMAAEDRYIGHCVDKLGYSFYGPKDLLFGEYSKIKGKGCKELIKHQLIHGLEEQDMDALKEELKECYT